MPRTRDSTLREGARNQGFSVELLEAALDAADETSLTDALGPLSR